MATLTYPSQVLPDFSQTFGPSQYYFNYGSTAELMPETEKTLEDIQSCVDLAAVLRESIQPSCSYDNFSSGSFDYHVIGTSENRYVDDDCVPLSEISMSHPEILKLVDRIDMIPMTLEDDDDNQSVVFEFEDLSFLDRLTTECNSDGEHSCESSSRDDTLSPNSLDSSDSHSSIPHLDYLCNNNKPKRFDFEDDSDEEEFEKPYCKSRRGAKNVLLWKFILQVLEARPDLAKWVNKREGTFKFVDTTVMSRMWGEKKRKRDMTFEKLSRGIRHYYKSGLMSRIEGTRLVYKFNWHQVPKPFRKN